MAKKKIKKAKKYFFFSRYLDEGEFILDVAHRHLLVLKVDSAKVSFFGLLIPLFLYWVFPAAGLLWILWMVIGVFALFDKYVSWYFDAWILTNVGIIDLDRDGFFDFTSTRLDYHLIEGVSYTVKGILQTIFNYGDMTVDKLGTKTSVILKDAANPKALERKMIAYQEKYVNSKSIRDHEALKGMLSEMIAYHVQNGKIES